MVGRRRTWVAQASRLHSFLRLWVKMKMQAGRLRYRGRAEEENLTGLNPPRRPVLASLREVSLLPILSIL